MSADLTHRHTSLLGGLLRPWRWPGAAWQWVRGGGGATERLKAIEELTARVELGEGHAGALLATRQRLALRLGALALLLECVLAAAAWLLHPDPDGAGAVPVIGRAAYDAWSLPLGTGSSVGPGTIAGLLAVVWPAVFVLVVRRGMQAYYQWRVSRAQGSVLELKQQLAADVRDFERATRFDHVKRVLAAARAASRVDPTATGAWPPGTANAAQRTAAARQQQQQQQQMMQQQQMQQKRMPPSVAARSSAAAAAAQAARGGTQSAGGAVRPGRGGAGAAAAAAAGTRTPTAAQGAAGAAAAGSLTPSTPLTSEQKAEQQALLQQQRDLVQRQQQQLLMQQQLQQRQQQQLYMQQRGIASAAGTPTYTMRVPEDRLHTPLIRPHTPTKDGASPSAAAASAAPAAAAGGGAAPPGSFMSRLLDFVVGEPPRVPVVCGACKKVHGSAMADGRHLSAFTCRHCFTFNPARNPDGTIRTAPAAAAAGAGAGAAAPAAGEGDSKEEEKIDPEGDEEEEEEEEEPRTDDASASSSDESAAEEDSGSAGADSAEADDNNKDEDEGPEELPAAGPEEDVVPDDQGSKGTRGSSTRPRRRATGKRKD